MSTITKKYHDKKMTEKQKEIELLQDQAAQLTAERDFYERQCENAGKDLATLHRQEGCDIGGKAQGRNIIEKAVQRAHKELESIKPNESNVVRLVRMLGNVQGILAAGLDGMHTDGDLRTAPFDPYPEETQARMEEQEINRYSMHPDYMGKASGRGY